MIFYIYNVQMHLYFYIFHTNHLSYSSECVSENMYMITYKKRSTILSSRTWSQQTIKWRLGNVSSILLSVYCGMPCNGSSKPESSNNSVLKGKSRSLCSETKMVYFWLILWNLELKISIKTCSKVQMVNF